MMFLMLKWVNTQLSGDIISTDMEMPLTQTTVTININGQKYYAKTDNSGYFRYDYKTSKSGTNTVTVSYPGNSNFQSASEYTTFNVKATKKSTILAVSVPDQY